jgi:hypothetical protein
MARARSERLLIWFVRCGMRFASSASASSGTSPGPGSKKCAPDTGAIPPVFFQQRQRSVRELRQRRSANSQSSAYWCTSMWSNRWNHRRLFTTHAPGDWVLGDATEQAYERVARQEANTTRKTVGSRRWRSGNPSRIHAGSSLFVRKNITRRSIRECKNGEDEDSISRMLRSDRVISERPSVPF